MSLPDDGPVERYRSYEKAYLAGELDPSFAGQSVWGLRMVVTYTVPGETKAWGREMIRNYRRDLVSEADVLFFETSWQKPS